MNHLRFYFIISLLILAGLVACAGSSDRKPATNLNVVATSTLIGDVVQQIGIDYINLTILMPPGSDPHNYQPVAQDISAVTRADLIFVNGLGFEAFLDELIANAGSAAQVVIVSDGITPLTLTTEAAHEENAAEEHEHDNVDPHVWFDPGNVSIWAQNVAQALAGLDATHADIYAANAAAYQAQLQDLDEWIQTEVARISPVRRIIVTDHEALGYFAQRYGFEVVGAIIPSFSTAAAPSAQELAQLQQAITAYRVPAIFVGTTANTTIATQMAQDAGVQLVSIYTGSLSESGGPATSYLDLMRYNVHQIVQALK